MIFNNDSVITFLLPIHARPTLSSYDKKGGDRLAYSIHVSLFAHTLTLQQNNRAIKTYPIGVGKMLTRTPIGTFYIINKAPNPGGPYGTMWIGLSKKHYGIHGTNNPASIGKNVSKGCIRMHNRDVNELARIVPIGTPVYIRP
ncbi:L,D-transpeptidase [Aneurinibacillus thermoaerophilus]|uniref:L,D-transpeptidase n=1 Tax=Aneurinibacillus thermoaerophilus TaxID=143495 RepID=UPI003908B7CC